MPQKKNLKYLCVTVYKNKDFIDSGIPGFCLDN